MKWNRLFLPFLCLVLALSACKGGDAHKSSSDTSDISDVSDISDISGVSVPGPDLSDGAQSGSATAAEPDPIADPLPGRDPEDVEQLEGSWECSGVFMDGQLVMFSDVPELGDLYDQILTINGDGTYFVIDSIGQRGTWAPMGSQPFEGFDRSYLFSKQYNITYDFENGRLTSNETKSSASYIISLSTDMPNQLVWLEKIGGESVLFLFQRDGSSTSQGGSTSPGGSTSAPPASPSAVATMGEQNALRTALSYLDTMAFSYSGLIEQLEYEGYTHSEAVYGADHCGADWNEQAALSAASYLDVMSFSRSGLIEQLEYEGFTHAQAVYGVEQNGY